MRPVQKRFILAIYVRNIHRIRVNKLLQIMQVFALLKQNLSELGL